MHILIDSPSKVGSIKVFRCQSFKAWKKKLKNEILGYSLAYAGLNPEASCFIIIFENCFSPFYFLCLPGKCEKERKKTIFDSRLSRHFGSQLASNPVWAWYFHGELWITLTGFSVRLVTWIAAGRHEEDFAACAVLDHTKNITKAGGWL